MDKVQKHNSFSAKWISLQSDPGTGHFLVEKYYSLSPDFEYCRLK